MYFVMRTLFACVRCNSTVLAYEMYLSKIP